MDRLWRVPRHACIRQPWTCAVNKHTRQQQRTLHCCCSSKANNFTVTSSVVAAAAACLLVLPTEANAALISPQASLDRSWAPCRPKTSCVSTNSFASPAQYLPPWSFQPDAQESAFRNLLSQLEDLHATVLTADAAGGYLVAQLPQGSSSEYDTVQFLLRPDGVVLFKAEASKNKPDPPFCLIPGCISGPANRQTMEQLRNTLGWTVLETDEDKIWVQILLH